MKNKTDIWDYQGVIRPGAFLYNPTFKNVETQQYILPQMILKLHFLFNPMAMVWLIHNINYLQSLKVDH